VSQPNVGLGDLQFLGLHIPTALLLGGSQQTEACAFLAGPGYRAYHSRGKLQQLPFGLLHALWIPFNADQVALLAVRRDADRNLILVFDSVDLG
jgi:hypothetical protein